ncbi:MAG: sodium-independent anion transporter [Streptosporangiaceae bacterium]
MIVYLPYAPLWYGNADYSRWRIREFVDCAAQPVRALVLDVNGISNIDYTAARALGELTRRGWRPASPGPRTSSTTT